jgi:hypothetical protein
VQPPAEGRPDYISGTLEIGEETVELLNFEALVTHQSAESGNPTQAGVQS